MNPDGSSSLFRWAPIALGLAVLWFAYLALFGPATSGPGGLAPPTLAPLLSPQPADFAWPLRDLDDKPVEFARYRGRTIVLNLWATWCGPCRAELPALAALAENPKIKEKGIAVICVSTDESADVLRGFLAGKTWPMTMVRATALPSAFTTDGIPATFIIAPDGKIVASELGAARWDDPAVIGYLVNLANSHP